MERSVEDSSDPLQPPCGPLLFVAVRADRTRLAGSIFQWVDVREYNFKFTLKKHYKSDGSVDDIAKGCKVAGRMFGGYGRRAMSLPYFVPLAPGHDEAVHVTDFLKVWARSSTSVSVVDVGPGTSISGPVGFAGGECSERGMGGQGGLPATPPDQEVGMSDDLEYNHLRAPSKPGLHGSRRQGLLGESPPRGGGDGERLRQGSESTTPRGLVREVIGSDKTTRRAWPPPAQLQTELSLEREASGNVPGEEEVSEQGLFRERSAEKTQSGGKRNLPDEEEREGVGALKRQRKVGGSAQTPTSREGGSVEKRKRVGGGDETPKDSSTQRRIAGCLVDMMDLEKKRLLNGVLNLNVVWVQTSSKKLAEQGKFSVKEMVDIIKMDRIMLRLWHYVEFEYEEMDKREWNANSTFFKSKRQLFEEFKDKGLDDKLWNGSRKFFMDSTYVNKCPQFLGCQHDNNIKRTVTLINDQHFPAEWKRVVLSVITGDRAKGKNNPRGVDECINIMSTRISALTTLAQFDVDPLSAIDHKEALGKLGHQLRSHTCVLDLCGTVDRAQWDSGAFSSLMSSKAHPCDFHQVVVEPVYDPNKDMFFKLTPKKRRQVYSFLYGEQPRLRFDPQYVVRKEVAIAVLQGYHGASRAGAVSFIKRLEYVFFNGNLVDPADFILDNYKLAFGEEDDFNIEAEQEESVEDDLFDLDGQLAIFNAQVSESPSVCKPGTPLATPTSGGPTQVSSSTPVKRGGLSRLRSSPGEAIRLTPQPEHLRPGHPVPPDHPHLKAPVTPFHMDDKHTFSTAEDWGHDSVWHPDHFQPVLLDGEWAVAVRDIRGGWIYNDRWDLETFKSRAYDAVLERLSEVN
ncbi:hypothetical protein CBR_g19194 [Chara braunii]|uniref:Uncharacterized protein n=1 Tax=Chara braunii TaxID=69332 RepID=A0A388JTN0_CHABU|nr:hypothetical protein CBR_g19194 [Chara braunii]|eukprot:GBG61117.1 hypothetical protein CBR_g19194 [Chara braunii]